MIACKRVVRRSVVCINGFIAITGSRKDESTARKSRINQATQEGSFLKINQTYKHSNNLLPIEDWSTKDVWNYLFQYSLDWLDDLALWNLYSDASGKGDECSFVGGGDKEVIEDGKVGCAKSRFGCWLCSLFKTDGAMDGLYKANGNMYLPYIEFREYMMKFQGMLSKKTSWAMHRDVYKHDTLGKKYYKKDNDITNPRFGMVMAGGFKLSIRLKLFIKLLRAEQKAKEKLVTDEEILYIQYRWLLEGDINFTAFKAIEKYRGYSFDYKSFKGLNSNVDKWIDTIETFMASKVNPIGVFDSEEYATLTKNRYLVQKVLGKDVRKMFFPTISEENKIRENWENDKVSKKDIQEVIDSGGLEIPIIETLFGEAIDRNKLPQSIYEIITK
jgi:DNA sulfur modification protein DndC